MGHRTSVALEDAFWEALDGLARADGKSLPKLIGEVDAQRLRTTPPPGLASALRVYVLGRARLQSAGGGET
jgi:predicted DNA-binding ribbon-helix-helix protein